jgi:hypothetical protein
MRHRGARRCHGALAAAAALAAGVTAAGVRAADLNLDPQAITRAISLGQTAVAGDLRRFHEPYRVDVSRAPVDYLEVVTPFRRIVLTAQARAGAGDRRWGQRQAIELEAAAPRQIDLYAELTFHPLNALVVVPPYRIWIALPTGELVPPRNTSSMPRYGPRVGGGVVPYTPTPLPGGPVPGRSQPMLGATILGSFDGDAIATACSRRCDAVIEEDGKTRVQVPLSLANLR